MGPSDKMRAGVWHILGPIWAQFQHVRRGRISPGRMIRPPAWASDLRSPALPISGSWLRPTSGLSSSC